METSRVGEDDSRDVKDDRVMRVRILYIFALILTLSSCFKDEEYDSRLIVRPQMQDVSDGEWIAYEGCVAHVFEANSDEWEVLSWDDAVAGILSSVEDSNIKKYASSTSSGYYNEDGLDEGSMLAVKANQQYVMLVVANTTDAFYACQDYTLGMNIGKTYIYSRFRSWKTSSYEEGDWTYFVP